MCGGKLCSFLSNLANYYRCVVAANGHIMTRNEPTVGVWWKYMSISDQTRRMLLLTKTKRPQKVNISLKLEKVFLKGESSSGKRSES